MTDDADVKKRQPQVVIFGAGIAGLTAAHELVERGFDVEVYEKEGPSPWEQYVTKAPCSIGGMARTQWARTTQRQHDDDPHFPAGTEPITTIPDEIDMSVFRRPPKSDTPGFTFPHPFPDIKALIRMLIDTFANDGENPGRLKNVLEKVKSLKDGDVLQLRGFCRERLDPLPNAYKPWRLDQLDPEELVDGLKNRSDVFFAGLVASYLRCNGVTCQLRLMPLGLGRRDDWTKNSEDRDYVSFYVEEDWVPGEHGFRFFPSFYRNLFDTMKRTPIPEGDDFYKESPRTVLDNVLATSFMGISTAGSKKPFGYRREPNRSAQEIFDQVTGMMKAIGLSLSDLNLFSVKLFKYMTSCRERRETQYENQSWAEFLEAERFSPAFQKYMDSTAEALVAMSARHSDARTYGNISLQMIQDQVTPKPRSDGTLNGPTSLVWFEHWRRYLENQGVAFHHGELAGFIWRDEHPWPVVKLPDCRLRVIGRDYYVLALPAKETERLTCEDDHLSTVPCGDFKLIRDFNWGDPTREDPGGSLDHMVGIQYFFASDPKVLEGHLLFPDSAWRLSAVSQPQFWTVRRGWWSGYRGILSVDVSNWHNAGDPSTGPGPAWQKTKDKIAREVWRQICETIRLRDVDGSERPLHTLPKPILYHLDENIVFARGTNTPAENRTPLLINRPGEYRKRPGIPGEYTLHFKSLVLAGTYMQTHTRLTTMEAANESGKHAVNAILRDQDFAKEELCRTENPEDNELDDLRFLLEIDRKLFVEHNLPHLVDILDLREVPRELLRPEPDLRALGLDRLLRSEAVG
jgi:uncharacterized protein with NAD-binding domain and iron-sulfur cluster